MLSRRQNATRKSPFAVAARASTGWSPIALREFFTPRTESANPVPLRMQGMPEERLQEPSQSLRRSVLRGRRRPGVLGEVSNGPRVATFLTTFALFLEGLYVSLWGMARSVPAGLESNELPRLPRSRSHLLSQAAGSLLPHQKAQEQPILGLRKNNLRKHPNALQNSIRISSSSPRAAVAVSSHLSNRFFRFSSTGTVIESASGSTGRRRWR